MRPEQEVLPEKPLWAVGLDARRDFRLNVIPGCYNEWQRQFSLGLPVSCCMTPAMVEGDELAAIAGISVETVSRVYCAI